MPDVAEFDRMFRAVEMTLVPQVPKDVRMRIQTARNLGVYAGFSYDLSAVSAYWSITCIEMALWNRSQEIDPSVHNTIVITKFHLEVITRSVRRPWPQMFGISAIATGMAGGTALHRTCAGVDCDSSGKRSCSRKLFQ